MSKRAQAISELVAVGAKICRSGDVRKLKQEIMAETGLTERIFGQRNQCGRKVKYSTCESAWQAKKRVWNPEVRPYHCDWCNGWHLGKPPRA